MFAGDKFKPAADASYKNLLWENFHVDHNFDIGTKIRWGNKIGTIASWGPFFRVSFDLIIHSHEVERNEEWSSLFNFRAYGSICEYCSFGYHKVPVLHLNNKFGVIMFGNTFIRSGLVPNKFLFKMDTKGEEEVNLHQEGGTY